MDFQNSGKLPVHLIIEFSVDANGGEKKIGQAFDYASLIGNKGQSVLLLTFHVDRKSGLKTGHQAKDSSNGKPGLKSGQEAQEPGNGKSLVRISQESFLYVHNEVEDKRKVAFLWREIYEKSPNECDLDFLKKSSEGLVRCLECVSMHRDEQLINENTDHWKVVSDNVAIDEGGGKVYKIFDNRFRPTYRRPNQWKQDLPWAKKLGVKSDFFYLQESDGSIDKLGYPSQDSRKRNRDESDQSSNESQTMYPLGSVRIISYNRVKGTHFASRASHFLQIADCIKEMHDSGIVHGDIRGFNMLHPFPEDQDRKDGISKSLLIDFDLSGVAGRDKYPPGYAKSVLELIAYRSGKAEALLEKSDDWKDFGAAMECYVVKRSEYSKLSEYSKRSEEWENIYKSFFLDAQKGYSLLKDFVKKRDSRIDMLDSLRRKIGDKSYAGTGSPNKHLQGARGSLRTTSIST